MSAAQPPPGSDGGGEGGLTSNVGQSFAIIPIVIAGGFFFTGIVFVTFRRQLGACLFGIGAVGGGHIGVEPSGRAPEGLSQEVIEGFPTYFYEDVKVHRAVDVELECAICLNQFQDHEVLRLMPECNHIFHPQCIDPWLHSQATCPVCRKILDPSNTHASPTRPLISSPINASEDNHHAIIMDPPSPVKSPVHLGPEQCGPVEPESTTKGQINEPKVVQPLAKRGDRFTLKLPEEARRKLESTLWRFAKSSSGIKHYRSKTPESGRIELNQSWCEPNRVSINSLNRSWRSFVSQPTSPFSNSGDTLTSVNSPT
ncbi:hypothetical protein V2J09_017033 [Rumex salicifolius]